MPGWNPYLSPAPSGTDGNSGAAHGLSAPHPNSRRLKYPTDEESLTAQALARLKPATNQIAAAPNRQEDSETNDAASWSLPAKRKLGRWVGQNSLVFRVDEICQPGSRCKPRHCCCSILRTCPPRMPMRWPRLPIRLGSGLRHLQEAPERSHQSKACAASDAPAMCTEALAPTKHSATCGLTYVKPAWSVLALAGRPGAAVFVHLPSVRRVRQRLAKAHIGLTQQAPLLTALPSSHCSPSSSTPSPHAGGVHDGQEQPSPLIVFPSSHSSLPSTMPSPHSCSRTADESILARRMMSATKTRATCRGIS